MEEYPTMIQDYEVQREYWGEGRGEGRCEEHGSSWVNTRENGYNGDNWLVDPWAGLQPFQLQAPKLTKKQKRRQKRSGDKSIAKDPFKVPEYTVGEELYLEVVPNHACPRVKTPDLRYLKFKAVKLLGTPWRSGCVMEVKCLETPDTDYIGRIFVLKLLDHRFLPMFNWFSEPTIRSMKRFINMVCCGAVDEFLAEAGHRVNLGGWKHDNYHSVKGLFSEWQQQALVHKSCQTVVEDEISAYERLRELQGKCIPKLMYRVRTCPWLNMEEPFSKYFQYEGFVMEKVDGVCLESVGRLPAFLQREIYQQAVNAINTLEYYGFEHKSLASRNLMVRHERQVSGVPYITLIDLHKHLTWSAEDGYFKYREVWNGSMETRMQYVSGFFDPWWDVDCRDDCKGDEWDEHIATGRFAEKNLFLDVNYQDPSDMALAGARRVVSPRALVNARLRWRVIMDDLWFVRSDKDRLQEIDERARLSRVAYKIMQVSPC